MQSGDDNLDYRETEDVMIVHGAIEHEDKKPADGAVPIPPWLIAIAMVVTFSAAYYLGAFSGGFSGDIFNERLGSSAEGGSNAGAGSGSGAAAPVETLAQQGKKVFTQNCVVCHQPTGMGLPPTYPPLVKSEWVLGTPKRAVMILLKGLQGPVHVKGQVFNGAMPAWGLTLTDKKIAAVLSYVRSEWGNNAGEITPDQVTAVRKEVAAHSDPWAEADLLAVPADAKLETPAPPAASASPAKK